MRAIQLMLEKQTQAIRTVEWVNLIASPLLKRHHILAFIVGFQASPQDSPNAVEDARTACITARSVLL